jgi:hypothetical protein
MAARLGVSGRRAHQTCKQIERRQGRTGSPLPLRLRTHLVAGKAGLDQAQVFWMPHFFTPGSLVGGRISHAAPPWKRWLPAGLLPTGGRRSSSTLAALYWMLGSRTTIDMVKA